jgi:hypothetical protein
MKSGIETEQKPDVIYSWILLKFVLKGLKVLLPYALSGGCL